MGPVPCHPAENDGECSLLSTLSGVTLSVSEDSVSLRSVISLERALITWADEPRGSDALLAPADRGRECST